jgi:hypothetical protein
MSGAEVEADSPPWIDPKNREVVIANKQRSFAVTEPEPEPKDDAEEEGQ